MQNKYVLHTKFTNVIGRSSLYLIQTIEPMSKHKFKKQTARTRLNALSVLSNFLLLILLKKNNVTIITRAQHCAVIFILLKSSS
jgi:hypothetical protein